jgi:hypothetical protein
MSEQQTKTPETSFKFICEWFGRAGKNAKANGREDSAQLWADGLAHLNHIAEQRDDLVKALQRAVEWCEEYGDTRHQWYADAREAIAKAGA